MTVHYSKGRNVVVTRVMVSPEMANIEIKYQNVPNNELNLDEMRNVFHV